MKIKKVRAQDIINAAVAFVGITILACYAIASAKKDTIYDVPIISDTFCGEPQNFISRFFLNVAAALLFAFALVEERFLNKFFDLPSERRRWTKFARYGKYVGCVTAFGLGGIASVQKNENVYLHGFAAFTFLLGALLWVLTVSFQMWKNFDLDVEGDLDEEEESDFLRSKKHRRKHLVIKFVSCLIGSLAMMIFVFVRMGPRGGFDRNYRILASAEWIAVVAIMTGVYSVGQDFGSGLRLSATWKKDGISRREKKLLTAAVEI